MIDRELTNSNVNDGKAEALNVRGRNMERNLANKPKDKRGKSKGKSKFCNYYKKKGHIINDCWKFLNKVKGNHKGQLSKSKEDSAKASYVEVECSDSGYVFIATNPYKSKYDWILDSRCTYHMSPNRNWFSTC